MSAFDNEKRKWCPHGRISIQKISAGEIEIVPFGGFNTIVDDTNTVHRPALCCEQCAHFQKNFMGRERCALEPSSLFFPIIAGSLIISLTLFALR